MTTGDVWTFFETMRKLRPRTLAEGRHLSPKMHMEKIGFGAFSWPIVIVFSIGRRS